MQLSDALGYLAATLTTVSFVPQAWRTFRTKDVSGISVKMYTLFTLGVAVWLAYGIVLGEVPMMIANATTLLLAIPVLVMRIKYGRKARQAESGGKREDSSEDKSRMARA
jgi:MtN3 and saliva related transmembrane protein